MERRFDIGKSIVAVDVYGKVIAAGPVTRVKTVDGQHYYEIDHGGNLYHESAVKDIETIYARPSRR